MTPTHIPTRACHVCTHSRIDSDHPNIPMLCDAPACRDKHGQPINIKDARHPAGPCGLEAHHLRLHGYKPEDDHP